MNPLFLCYDTSRIPQALDLAKRCKLAKQPAIIVVNPNSGWFGSPASLEPWQNLLKDLRNFSPVRAFGYIDLLDSQGKLKDYNTLCAELTSWAHVNITDIFLDDARASHKGMLLKLTQKFPGHQFLANPGTYTPSLRGIPHIALVEQEDNSEKVKILSRTPYLLRPQRKPQDTSIQCSITILRSFRTIRHLPRAKDRIPAYESFSLEFVSLTHVGCSRKSFLK